MVNADIIAACSGKPAAKTDWLGAKVGGHLSLLCIHQINLANSGSDCHADSTINIIVSVIPTEIVVL